jgi:hypothetical protein
VKRPPFLRARSLKKRTNVLGVTARSRIAPNLEKRINFEALCFADSGPVYEVGLAGLRLKWDFPELDVTLLLRAIGVYPRVLEQDE